MIEKALNLVNEYKVAMKDMPAVKNAASGGQRIWRAPTTSVFKIDSDVAIFGDRKLGFGGIVRDKLGEVMLATCAQYDGGCDTDIEEALAARHAVTVAVEAGLRNVVMENDCLKLISHLQKRVKENNGFGFIVTDILFLGSSSVSLSFNHVRREGNRVAHKLAQISKEYREMRVWIEEVPNEVRTYVHSDMISMNEYVCGVSP